MGMIVAVAAWAVVGTLGAGGWWWVRPKHYVSTSILRPQTADPQVVSDAERSALGDYSLASIIERENLYPEERKQSGMGAAIRRMRDHAIRVQEAENLGPVIVLSFEYSDAQRAQATAHDLVAAIQATGMKCEVIVDASTPLWPREDQEGALPLAAAGFGGGLGAGLLFAAVWWIVRRG
jgi:hypothetical protein